jgi:peptide/nickel transport system substrate-binding protein
MHAGSMNRRRFATASLGVALAAAAGRPAPADAQARRSVIIGMPTYPPALDPVLFNHTPTRRIVPQLFDTLLAVDYDKGRTLRPALAEQVERIDAQSLRVRLREGVTFHDGSPLTAEDVAFSLGPDHLLGPNRAGNVVSMGTLGTLARVEIVDPGTVVVHAKGADALLEQRLASWASQIVSKRAFDAAGSWDRWAQAPVGSGPYRLVEQRTDVRVRLRANDSYWGGKPPFESVEYRHLPEVAARVSGLLAGDLDLITDVPPDQFATIRRRSDLEVVGGDVQNIRYLVFDCTDPVLRDVRIRRAMSLAIDRALIVSTLWDGGVSIPNGLQMASFGTSYVAEFPMPAYDPRAARDLLRQAGYGGELITYKLLNNYYGLQVATAQVMVEMWRSVGLNVKLQMLENFSQIYKTPIHAVFDNSATADFPDHLGQGWRVFGPRSQNVATLGIWRNDEYAQLGQILLDSVDPTERRNAHRRMLEILAHDDPPAILLHTSGQFYAKRRDIAWRPIDTVDMDFGPFNAGRS